MSWRLKNLFDSLANKKTTILLLSVVFFFASATAFDVFAQKEFSRRYPASKNVRLELSNRTGTVTVEGWERPEIYIYAYMEKPSANIVPQNLAGKILINLIKDNQGRGEIGSVNFHIKVPYSSSVDIQTVIGNLTVSNVQGMLVRAKITTEGDITLTNIGATMVAGENKIGDIFFDGVIQPGGIYRFDSMRGNINLRIPSNSSFQLVATAPSTRNIQLGSFSSSGLSFVSSGRQVVGKTGNGAASLTVTNHRGSIAFLTR
jgi:hypothetical protein